jgi:hypothetical protein
VVDCRKRILCFPRSLLLKMCMWVFGLLIGFWSLSPVISIEECSDGYESLLSYS